MGYVNNPAFAALTLTGSTTTVYSPTVNKGRAQGVSFEAVLPGGATSAGTFQVYGSNDGLNFAPITGASAALTSGAANIVIDCQTFCMYTQLGYIPTSGPGTDIATVSYTFPLWEQ